MRIKNSIKSKSGGFANAVSYDNPFYPIKALVLGCHLLTWCANSLSGNVLYTAAANVGDPNNNDSHPDLLSVCKIRI